MNFEEAIKQVTFFEEDKFPTEAVEYINSNKELFENQLIDILKNYADNPSLYELDKDDHISSLLFLSQFQSKTAFPVLVNLLKSLPYSVGKDQPFGDLITEIVPYSFAACFDGHFETTLDLIGCEEAYLFSRICILRMLEICIFLEKLSEQEVLNFYDVIIKQLCEKNKEDEFLQYCMERLASISLDKMEKVLVEYGISLNREMEREINYLRKNDDKYYLRYEEKSIKNYNDLVTKGMKLLKKWNMFSSFDEDNFIMNEYQKQDAFASDKKSISKVGRNHSCPCGSGKKFKKCCLQ